MKNDWMTCTGVIEAGSVEGINSQLVILISLQQNQGTKSIEHYSTSFYFCISDSRAVYHLLRSLFCNRFDLHTNFIQLLNYYMIIPLILCASDGSVHGLSVSHHGYTTFTVVIHLIFCLTLLLCSSSVPVTLSHAPNMICRSLT